MDQLYQSCIKLASENKISQKNTWSLGLIDHLSDLVKPSGPEGAGGTNFQRASCTLEAGIKIYSHRVDSVHSEVRASHCAPGPCDWPATIIVSGSHALKGPRCLQNCGAQRAS